MPARCELLGVSAVLGVGLSVSPALAAAPKPTGLFPVRPAQVQANGASFRLVEQGEGPAVLFCHGFPDTAETWRGQMRAVAEAGHRAVALDIEGTGSRDSAA